MCTSEENDRERLTPTIAFYPLNYCLNEGTWFIYDPVSDTAGDGAFAPTARFAPARSPTAEQHARGERVQGLPAQHVGHEQPEGAWRRAAGNRR